MGEALSCGRKLDDDSSSGGAWTRREERLGGGNQTWQALSRRGEEGGDRETLEVLP